MTGLSEEELIARSGVASDRVRHFIELKILEPAAEGFRPPDIQLARLYEAFDQAGISPEQISALMADGAWSNAWADLIFPNPHPFSEKTLDRLAVELDLPRSLIERTYAAWQLPMPGWEEPVREDDVEYLGVIATIFNGVGRNEDASIPAARIFGDNLRRIAESQVRFFREHVEDPLYSSGLPMRDAIQTAAELGKAFMEKARHGMMLLHARHMEHYIIEDIVQNLELTLEQAGMAQRRPDRPPAIAFLDLSGYTSLTELEGDQAAVRLAEGLGDMVQAAATRHRGRVVKLLGDGVMFHVPDPADAILLGLDLVREAPERGLPKARMGVHAGPVIFRDADYFGRTVNVAARVTDYARPSEVLVTADAAQTGSPDGVELSEIGEVSLKGLSAPVALFLARPA
ncbi:MAG TPA: adenylate/guanylate cyclase domain-containing protein [Actinomycetota bacterium]|jgi:adenylate cyclase|nr:adenylate/guanylate cyclase domain-containing protein [Actinomycetota bacterium]